MQDFILILKTNERTHIPRMEFMLPASRLILKPLGSYANKNLTEIIGLIMEIKIIFLDEGMMTDPVIL